MSKMDGDVRIPAHETFKTAALLAVVGGFLDAYTYILRGGVFANAQTGNIVLLAVLTAEGKFRAAAYYIAPIAAFTLGVFVTEVLKRECSRRDFVRFEYMVIVIEILLLGLVGWMPAAVPDDIVNVTISFICSIQVNTFRKVRNVPYASTMCTGNLRSGAEKLFSCIVENNVRARKSAVHYFGIIGLFILGAMLGTALAHLWGLQSIWICCLLLLAVLAGIGRSEKNTV